MFGLFGNSDKKLIDPIGEQVHRQVTESLERHGDVMRSPDEMMWVSGYIYGLVEDALELNGNNKKDEERILKSVRHLCNGVLPGKLWDIFQKSYAFAHNVESGGEPYQGGYKLSKEDSKIMRSGGKAGKLTGFFKFQYEEM